MSANKKKKIIFMYHIFLKLLSKESSKFAIGSHQENTIKILMKTQMLKSMSKLQVKNPINFRGAAARGIQLQRQC